MLISKHHANWDVEQEPTKLKLTTLNLQGDNGHSQQQKCTQSVRPIVFFGHIYSLLMPNCPF